MRRLCAAALVGALCMALPLRAQETSLTTVLQRTAGYIDDFRSRFTGLVAEEVYEQRVVPVPGINEYAAPSLEFRSTRADLVLVRPPGTDRYVDYRDVFEVDGKPVRERGDRLSRLLESHSTSAQAELQRIMNESARYNIGMVTRTINTPIVPLTFIDRINQRRSRFTRVAGRQQQLGRADGDRQADDAPVFRVATEMWTIEFRETDRNTLVRTPQGRRLPAHGRFWVNPGTGAVLMCEVILAEDEVKATVRVSYQSEPLVGFLVPVEMREQYRAGRTTIDARAVYGRFRLLADLPGPSSYP